MKVPIEIGQTRVWEHRYTRYTMYVTLCWVGDGLQRRVRSLVLDSDLFETGQIVVYDENAIFHTDAVLL